MLKSSSETPRWVCLEVSSVVKLESLGPWTEVSGLAGRPCAFGESWIQNASEMFCLRLSVAGKGRTVVFRWLVLLSGAAEQHRLDETFLGPIQPGSAKVLFLSEVCRCMPFTILAVLRVWEEAPSAAEDRTASSALGNPVGAVCHDVCAKQLLQAVFLSLGVTIDAFLRKPGHNWPWVGRGGGWPARYFFLPHSLSFNLWKGVCLSAHLIRSSLIWPPRKPRKLLAFLKKSIFNNVEHLSSDVWIPPTPSVSVIYLPWLFCSL